MADKLDVQVTGKSKFEVAHMMATHVLFNIEKKNWETITRTEYLNAVSEAIDALSAVRF